MPFYLTRDPVPSADMRNVFDNAQNLDLALNDLTSSLWTDRLGRSRMSWFGLESAFSVKLSDFESRFTSQIVEQEATFDASQADKENRFQHFLVSSGYVFLGDYEDGPFQFSARNQYIRYDNQYYRLNAATDVGFTTTGTTTDSFSNDVTHFVLMDGDTLRQDLSSAESGLGAHLVNSVYGHRVVEYLYPTPEDFFVGTFFDDGRNKTIYLASSPDGTTFYRLNTNQLAGVNAVTTGRDPSLTYFQGYWYIAYTGSQNLGNIGDFTVMRSRDMISWTSYPVKAYGNEVIYKKPGNVIGGNIASIKDVWAPCLWTDGDSLFAGLTVSFNDDTKDRDGATVTWQAPISMRCSDIENMIFDMPKLMFINQDVPRIDIEVTKDASFYYAVVKNEFSKNIELWRSVAPDTGYQQIGEINFGRYVEGASLVYNNAKHLWYVYADAYQLQGTYYYCTSQDLITWSEAVKVSADFQMRHGSICNLSNIDASVSAIESFKTATALYHAQGVMQQLKVKSVQYLTDSASIDPAQDVMYAVTGTDDITLTIPMNYHPHECTVFYVCKMSQAATGGIKVTGAMVDGTYKIGYGDSNLSGFAFILDPSSKKYRCLGIPSFDALRSKGNTWSATNTFNGTLDVAQWLNIGQSNGTAGVRRLGLYTGGDGAVKAYVQGSSSGELQIQGNAGIASASNLYPTATASALTLGKSTNLWSTVYAQNSSISTSDSREKSELRDLNEAEIAAFWAIGRLPWVWKWLSRYQAEGDNARLHSGPTVQAAIEIMTEHGLDWTRYAAFCYDEWDALDEVWEEWPAEYETVPARTAIIDNGVLISEDVPEQQIQIREAGRILVQAARPAGNRYSFRKEELLLWILRATIEKQQSIETRIAALENAGS
ncbi:TPA: hypothetical protein MWR99_003140 [Klebsiella pneumoniae]|nr:hypothetical protein [Klebsiella pneumoniae]